MINKIYGKARNKKEIITDFSNDCWNGKVLGVIDDVLTPQTIVESPIKVTTGACNFKNLISLWVDAFPDLVYIQDEILYDCYANRVVCRWKVKGIHAGDFYGIPATNRRIDYRGTTFFTVINGKIVNYYADVNLQDIISQINDQNKIKTNAVESANDYLCKTIEQLIGYSLSRRRIECLSLYLMRMTKVKIGEILFISENTVKTHISQTLDAMNVKK
ncbi:hypothetical protein AVM71_16280 (plasmid) [Piscirickettsia salmonis]|nr:hypothetical protein AVM71_16280 [Piscirickettsia salmonis]